MGKITVVGLGPGDIKYLTMEAFEHLMSGKPVYMRTEKHPTLKVLAAKGLEFQSFDNLYDQGDSFDSVYQNIADKLVSLANEHGDILYGVPGNPFVAERTVEILSELAKDGKMFEMEVIYGPSFIDATLTALGRDPVAGLTIADALKIHDLTFDITVDQLIIQVYDNAVASQVKIKLAEYYGDDHPCLIVRGAGIQAEEVIREVSIYELDRTDIPDHLTSVFVPRVADSGSRKHFFNDLVKVMDTLRGPDGCPWDREQTHQSLRPYLIEEVYEVIDAIDHDDLDAMIEELGDLLLQIVFHAQIARESGYFDINDVTDGISKKLITRHPHVFADTSVANSDEVLKNWENIKLEEKSETVSQAMKRIPSSLPALMRAYKIQKKAAEVGFDWTDVKDAIAKIREELEEFEVEFRHQKMEAVEAELGDLLFAVVNVCRFFKVNPDFALNKTSEKFMTRFSFIEDETHKMGKKLPQMTLEDMDELWNMAKTFEK